MAGSCRVIPSWRTIVTAFVLTSLCVRLSAMPFSESREKLLSLLSHGALHKVEGVRAPRDVAFDMNNSRAVIADMQHNRLVVLSLPAGDIVTEFEVKNGPVSVAVCKDGAIAAVAQLYSNEISFIDLATMQLQGNATIPSGASQVRFSPEGADLYVLSRFGNTLARLDAQHRTVTGSVEIASFPETLTVSPDGRVILFTARFPSRIVALNAANLTVSWETMLEGDQIDLAVVSRRLIALVKGKELAKLIVLDVSTGALVVEIELKFDPVSLAAFDQAGCTIITGRGGAVYAFDPASPEIMRVRSLSMETPRLMLSPEGSSGFAADDSSGAFYTFRIPPFAPASHESQKEPIPTEPAEKTRVTYESDLAEVLDLGKVYRGTGHVRITGKDAEFTSDEVTYDTETNSFHALGHVTMKRETTTITADEATYDIESETGELLNCRGTFDPWYFRAPRLERTGPDTGEIDGGYLTTCDQDPPHYRIPARKLKMIDGKTLAAEDLNFSLGQIPIFRIPRYTWKLGEARIPLEVDVGHDSDLGYSFHTGYNFGLTEKFSGTAHGDLYTKEVFGAGLDGKWTPLEDGEANFRTYITAKERGLAEVYYTQEISQDWRAIVQHEQWSEEEFIQDLDYDEYKRRTEPTSYVNLTRTRPYDIISATVRKNANSFVDETERLPEVNVTLLERQIGTTALYYSVEDSFGYLTDPMGEDSAVRNMTGARISYAGHPTNWLSVVPFVGADGTYYSEDREDETDLYRTSFLSGVTFGTRMHKVYGSPAKSISAFKHIVVPTITYTHRSIPTVEDDELYKFDAIDSVVGRDRIGFELDNVLLCKTVQGEQRQFARLTLFSGTDVANEQRKNVDLGTVLQINPTDQLAFSLEADSHNAGEDFRRFITTISYKEQKTGGREARLRFGYTETEEGLFKEDLSYLFATNIGEKWRISLEHRFDFKDNDLEYQEYRVWRELHCFEGAISYRIREKSQGVYFLIGLRAFPKTKLRF